MKNRSNRDTLVFIFAFLLGLGLGCLFNAKARIVRHVLNCKHFVYFVGDSRERPQTLEQEVERKSQFLLVGVFVNTKEDVHQTDILYNDFSPETNIKFIFFTAKRTMSLHNIFVALEGLNASTEPKLKYLRMFHHVSQHYGDKFSWFMFTESNYFVNMDKLGFLKHLQHSNTKEFLFMPHVERKSSINNFGHVLLDSFTKNKEYTDQNSQTDIVHVIQPGMIFSRPLLQRISSLTESCMNRKRGLRNCLHGAAMFLMTDSEVFEIVSTL